MSVADWIVLGGIVLAILGAGSIVVDGALGGGEPRFVAYLVALLLVLVGVGVVLSVTL